MVWTRGCKLCSVDRNVAFVNLVGFVSLSQLFGRQIDVLVTVTYKNTVMVHWLTVGLLYDLLTSLCLMSASLGRPFCTPPLLCQGSKWLNGKSVWLVFWRSWFESQLDLGFFPWSYFPLSQQNIIFWVALSQSASLGRQFVLSLSNFRETCPSICFFSFQCCRTYGSQITGR